VSLPLPANGAPVPVALFVYRRHRQLQRTLACLRACGIEMLHVFADGAAGRDDAEDVAEVRRILGEIDWIEPVVSARAANAGLSRSIRDGLDALFEHHPAAIVIEDDVCVAPEFYDFARLALSQYAGQPLLAGVTGLRLPFDRSVLAPYPYDVFLSPRFSSWGWATWRERWREFCFDRGELRHQIAADSRFDPERAGADLTGMIYDAIVTGSLTGSWDALCATNMLLRGQYFLTPAWNMIENTGFAEGTHVGPGWQLRWEPEHMPPASGVRFCPVAPDEGVLREYRRFIAGTSAPAGLLARVRTTALRWRMRRTLRRPASRTGS
jgi:hypothetical protein